MRRVAISSGDISQDFIPNNNMYESSVKSKERGLLGVITSSKAKRLHGIIINS